ncbi:hypothetical protein EJ05DRAFT_475603 [Pseudovirgaria hyperparasitica]|uniref:Uncharacterized protein n=1 Tax=Pseudovirgaria hyperparasitica TaxID=470096 RepID=A0A6A6WB27_9PEZI|nr:uncharacterized protein EJ05DRAFT_475603 [Pseudovirgaria hyperparasitica]KAF2759389.1 hypothetical protein EJ05DRAFT_475603 [Pseudovirgaria hyperparasitica]
MTDPMTTGQGFLSETMIQEALREGLGYITGNMFHAEEEDRTIRFVGAFIRISKRGTKPLELTDIAEIREFRIPAGYYAEVIDGYAKLTKCGPSPVFGESCNPQTDQPSN